MVIMGINRQQTGIILLFWCLTLVELAAVSIPVDLLHIVVKPILIPILLLLLQYSHPTVSNKRLFLIGLFFSWVGDVLLMFDKQHQLFFIFGLVCFLITHVCYILFFAKISSPKPSLLRQNPILIALVLTYGITLVWQLFPYLHQMKLPVMLYATVICTMLLSSLHIYNKVNRNAAVYYVSGAIAFVLSDSILAINKFYQPFELAGLFIMLSYCTAQFLMVRGYIAQKNVDK